MTPPGAEGPLPEWTAAMLDDLKEIRFSGMMDLQQADRSRVALYATIEMLSRRPPSAPVVSEAAIRKAIHLTIEACGRTPLDGGDWSVNVDRIVRAALGAAPREGEPWRWAIEFAPAGDRSERVILDDVLFKSQKEAETECAMRQALHPHDARRAVPIYAAPVGTEGREAVIEECARVCDSFADEIHAASHSSDPEDWSGPVVECAERIRALAAAPRAGTGEAR